MPDSTAFLKGFAVSADLIGPLMLGISDNGHFEAALRINLKDKYFPVVELGYGKADHSDDVTRITYKTSAPYGRIGLDLNLMKNKHDSYRGNVLVDPGRQTVKVINLSYQAVTINWEVKRMPGIDRNILRMAIYEMRFGEEKVPVNVAVNEAVELAKQFGTEKSARFINGVLGKLMREEK